VELFDVFTPGMGVHVVGGVGGLVTGSGRQTCQYTVVVDMPVTWALKVSVPFFKTVTGELGDEPTKGWPAALTLTAAVVLFEPQPDKAPAIAATLRSAAMSGSLRFAIRLVLRDWRGAEARAFR
jgi:hypothetical protein